MGDTQRGPRMTGQLLASRAIIGESALFAGNTVPVPVPADRYAESATHGHIIPRCDSRELSRLLQVQLNTYRLPPRSSRGIG